MEIKVKKEIVFIVSRVLISKKNYIFFNLNGLKLVI